MKAAGGVSNSKAALHRLVLVKDAGRQWLTPDRFRIGASSLLNDLLMQYPETQTRRSPGPRTSLGMSTQEARTKVVWDYAPAPESPDHVRLRETYGLFIDGGFPRPGGRPPRAHDQPGHRAGPGRGGLRR